MDIDVFVARHEKTWSRLEFLVDKRRLTGHQCDELISLYHISSAHLSYIQSTFKDKELILFLSRIVAKANTRMTSSRKGNMKGIAEFFTHSLPACLYECRKWTAACAVVFILIALVQCVWILHSPDVLSALGSADDLRKYATEDFVKYYTNYGASDFTTQVWVNNAYIAANMVAFGITGFMPLYRLYQNAVAIGISAAVVYTYNDIFVFFKFILPHGLLELTAIFIACGAGIKLFWALVVPTNESRKVSIAKQGRSTVIIGLGLVFILLFAGLIEGYITGSNLQTWIKIFIGIVSVTALWIYTLVVGRVAYNKGIKADIDESEAGYVNLENG